MGKTPDNIQRAYKLKGHRARGRTVAIVDAYGYPNAARELNAYRANFGLSPCRTANRCLRIMNQEGSSLPAFNLGWSQEQALDPDAVSAACPTCRILLVQARTNSFKSLGAGVDTAARQPHVSAISNSYGEKDVADSRYGSAYSHKGTAITASTGDQGHSGASFPSSSRYVTAVGGTSLTTANTPRGWKESAWAGTGSGCATRNNAPTGQKRKMTHCNGRAIADVSADANPRTGLAVYAPTSRNASSWAQYGGTSLSSPIVAAVYALSGVTARYANRLPYLHRAGLFDVTSGKNRGCPFRCSARAGWDGPTGLGTPNGLSAF